jgi:hypothetical protein
VSSSLDHSDDLGELVEVIPLRCSQWVLFEERNYYVPQIAEPQYAIPEHILPVIVMPSISIDLATPKETDEAFKNIDTCFRLHNRKLRLYLPADSAASIPKDRAAKTPFPIHETHNPSYVPESFLLITRTSHIVTDHHMVTVQTACDNKKRQ